MKFKPLWAKKHYYKRIILIMIVFSFLLFLPFSFVSYRISQKNILNSINASSRFFLSRINYNYNYFSQTSSKICMESFLSNTVQQFLYSNDIDNNEVYSYMKNMSNTTLQTNSSISSIVIYNHKRNEWFSTEKESALLGQELTDFISTQQSIPKLQPVLRMTVKKQGHFEIPLYVFSYFMYQFSDPVNNTDSYIVVNEDAGWFVENIASIKQSGDFIDAIYLINESGIVYSSENTIEPEISQSIYNDFWANHADLKNQETQYVVLKYGKKTYLISSMQMGGQKNFLLIVQNYNEVFRDLLNLQKEYVLFAIVFLGAIIILLQLFSKRIYSPLQIFMEHISESNSASGLSIVGENEFDYLHSIYQNANELNERLLTQSELNEPVIEQFQLIRLTANTSGYLKEFEKTFPKHWLIIKEELSLCVLLVKVDEFKNNKHHFEDTDINLLNFAVRNIFLELFSEKYEYVTVFQDLDALCIIVNLFPDKVDSDVSFPLIEDCQEYIGRYLDVTVSVSYSGVTDSVLYLDKIFREAKECLSYRFIFGPGSTINRKRCLINFENEQTNYPYQLDEKLVESIMQKDISSVMVALEDVRSTLYNFQYANITMCIMALVNKIVFALNQMKNEDLISPGLKVNDLYKKAVNAEFMETFFDELGQYISSALSCEADMDIDRRDALDINNIMEFVQNNFSNTNLSSQMISDHLGLSNRYVMYKFKECTSMSLNEYILNIRMRKAANLLQNTDLPINKIVTQVGIESDTYFYRLFKKVYHCTPREFSQQHRNKS